MDTVEFIAKYGVTRKQTDSLKWDALEERFGSADLLPLWVADMEFKVPDGVTAALQERISHGVYGYSQIPANYFPAFAAWQKKRHGVLLQPEWLRFSRGVVESLLHLVQIYSQEKEAVLIQPPVYYPFANVVKLAGRRLVESPLKQMATGYQMDLVDFEKKIQEEQVKIFILCSPHNPVGRVWSAAELTAVLEICQKYDVLVIADEIHQDYILQAEPFISVLKVADGAFLKNVIVVNAPSKTFNLASLLNGHILIPDDSLRRQFDRRIGRFSQSENSLLGLIAGAAAYETGEEWFDQLLTVIRQNYHYVATTLTEVCPQVKVGDLQGTYLLWIDLSQVCPSEKLETFIKDECGLAVDFGSWFAKESGGFIRMNLATVPRNIEKAVAQLIQGIQKGVKEND